METAQFPESNHPLVKSLFHHSDRELLTLFQNYPDRGRYFTGIYCRYGAILKTLIQHSVRSPVQADYLFARTWQHIFYELRGLDLRANPEGDNLTLQNWLINMAAVSINEAELPPVESIHYSLETSPPPLWCYMGQVLDQLEPLLRLIVLMAETFHWSETRIAAYLQAEGEAISPQEVKSLGQEGCQLLETELPEDIRGIYLDEELPVDNEPEKALQF